MPINTVKVYHNLALVLYTKGLVLKTIIAISVVSTAVNKWLKALLASFVLIKATLLGVKSLKAVK